MHIDSVIAIIPARLRSERLPSKPLHLLAGRPLIEWVWRRVSSLQCFDDIVIATDSDRIAEACRAFGARVAMTAATHPSGTDRVAEVAATPEFANFGTIVNVQGDEPFVTEAQVMGAIEAVRAGYPIGTVATPVRDADTWRDPAVVKVVRGDDGCALYFSRAPIPFERSGGPDGAALSSDRYLRHIGVYAYTPEGLRRWVSLPAGELEQIERLEQLRPLAAGMKIGVGIVGDAEIGVDTMEDALRAEARLLHEGVGALQPTVD